MPYADAGGLRVHYALEGPSSAPLVVLSHSLGSDLSMWDGQAAILSGRRRVLRYDTRGHGRTEVTAGPYSIEQLAGDVIALMGALGLGAGDFCGLSLGGQIGMWLAARAPARVRRLVLCNTAARVATTETWNARIDAVRAGGMAAVTDPIVARWFSPAFTARSPETVARTRRALEATPPEGYVGASLALRESDLEGLLPSIAAPTLVISGSVDPSTPPEQGRRLAAAIPDARYVELQAAHLSNLEAAEDFNATLAAFLAG